MRSGTIAFLLGIAAIQWLETLPAVQWSWLLVLLLPVAWFSRRLRLPALVVCGFLWALAHAAWLLDQGLPAGHEGQDLVVQGFIDTLPVRTGRVTRFEFQVDRLTDSAGVVIPIPGRLRLAWYGDTPELMPGQGWGLPVRLKRPHGLRNPGGFDYEKWLFQRGVRASGYVYKSVQARRMTRLDQDRLADRLRQEVARRLHDILGGRTGRGIITALAVGERSGIDTAQWAVLVRTGTSHLVAISGLHVGLVTGLVFFLFRRLWALSATLVLWCAASRAAVWPAMLAGSSYAALAGFSVPTVRALIMACLVLGGVFLARNTRPGHVLTVALLAVLVPDPLAAFAPGFWLSFGAVAVILYGTLNRLAPGSRWRQVGRVQWVVTLGLAPLTLAFFGQVSLVAPAANLLAVPWVSFLVVPPVLAGVALLGVSPALGAWSLYAADAALGPLWWLLEYLADSRAAIWSPPALSGWALPAFSLGALLVFLPRGFPGRVAGVALLAAVFTSRVPAPQPGEAWIDLLDLGQGLGLLVRTRQHVLLFDTGPRYSDTSDAGRQVILPALREMGIQALDTLVLSHGDMDHVGGAGSVLREIPTRRILVGTPVADLPQDSHACHTEPAFNRDGVSFEFLHPRPRSVMQGNNASCVLRIQTSGGSMLIAGDIEREAELALLADAHDELRADFLIVPHHGSSTSSMPGFVRAVSPQFALVATGYRNRFGFPRPEVVARYHAIDARVLDTAKLGAIHLRLTTAGWSEPASYRLKNLRFWHTRDDRPPG